MTKVSIIIPMYNQARFAAQAIRSALEQTHPAVEVIGVDDGSTDETPAVARGFASSPNFKYIRQENRGLPGARNRGLAESTGDYVCFLDCDDYLAPEKVAKQAQLLDENPELGFVYCDILTVDEAGQPLAEQFSVGKMNRVLSGNIFRSLAQGGYFPPHTVMIRRSVLGAVGDFDPELGGHADYELWLRVAGAGYAACYQDEPLAFYRNHGESMSKDGLHMAETRAAAFRKIARLYPDRVADGLDFLQQSLKDAFDVSQWLRNPDHAVDGTTLGSSAPARPGRSLEVAQAYPLLPRLKEAQLRGNPDQAAIWEATLEGRTTKALYLQPPAELTFQVPTGVAGCLQTALTIHPDAWDRPGAGGCEFHIRADGRLAFALVLDPTHLPADRRWHEIRLEIPENAAGFHTVSLETRAVGPADYRWALWRAPRFVGQSAGKPVTQ